MQGEISKRPCSCKREFAFRESANVRMTGCQAKKLETGRPSNHNMRGRKELQS